MSAVTIVTSAARTRNVLVVWFCSHFFGSFLTLGSSSLEINLTLSRSKFPWIFSERDTCQPRSPGRLSPGLANEEVVRRSLCVQCELNEAIMHLNQSTSCFIIPRPPAFLHLVTRKLNFIYRTSDARHIRRDAAWSHHMTTHVTCCIRYLGRLSHIHTSLWPLHGAIGPRALKVAWSMPPTMLLMSDISQNTKIKHLTPRQGNGEILFMTQRQTRQE